MDCGYSWPFIYKFAASAAATASCPMPTPNLHCITYVSRELHRPDRPAAASDRSESARGNVGSADPPLFFASSSSFFLFFFVVSPPRYNIASHRSFKGSAKMASSAAGGQAKPFSSPGYLSPAPPMPPTERADGQIRAGISGIGGALALRACA